MWQYFETVPLKALLLTLATVSLTSSSDAEKVFNVNVFLEAKIPDNALSCEDAKQQLLITNGKTKLEVPDYPDPFYVSCYEDPEHQDAWTIIQRRQNGHVDFDRDWIDYVRGFGDVDGEHFMGLAKLHALTKSQPHELLIELEYFNGNHTYAIYNSFLIGDKDSNYKLSDLGAYCGNAGDALSKHKGQQFTTKDADHDSWKKGNCAEEYNGGWWFKACLDSNLNGQYYGNGVQPAQKWGGVYWYDYTDWDLSYSLKYAHMAIRPKPNNKLKSIYIK